MAAVLLVFLGYALGTLIPRWQTPGDTSPEAGFARDMSAHHAQAVELGMIAYQKGTDPEVRTLGRRHRHDPAGSDRHHADLAHRLGAAAHQHPAAR